MATATKQKTKAAATKPPKDVEDEVLDDELEELEEDEVSESAPAKGGGAQEVTFGASDLAKYLTKKHGKEVSPRELRTLIRKMARDGSGRVTREIQQGNRSRYNWSGVNDPEVKAIIAAFEGGELEADKKEKLAALKERKAAQVAAKKAEAEKAGGGTKGNKKASAAVVEEDEEDLELEEADPDE